MEKTMCVYCDRERIKNTISANLSGVPFASPPITGTDPYTGEEVDRRFKV